MNGGGGGRNPQVPPLSWNISKAATAPSSQTPRLPSPGLMSSLLRNFGSMGSSTSTHSSDPMLPVTPSKPPVEKERSTRGTLLLPPRPPPLLFVCPHCPSSSLGSSSVALKPALQERCRFSKRSVTALLPLAEGWDTVCTSPTGGVGGGGGGGPEKDGTDTNVVGSLESR